ncbi:Uu.00g037290.m01.CDS01 [Anthostomella pinea]|uniref:Uu.00g037290.m01.CDS01 n=1 Tax=Anthostomella pinea TaxID=933095 RepID=A0AAI8VAM1_9PEZI|nr:Uu.00g037290.m01.CDS01 [Anthostomella pinea]
MRAQFLHPVPSLVRQAGCETGDLAYENGTYWTPMTNAADWPTLAFSNPCLNDIAQLNTSVKYCLAQLTSTPCRIAISPLIMYAVVAANALKMVCLICTWFLVQHRARHEGEERLVTEGDIIASYLRQPDLRFAGPCLASSRLVRGRGRTHELDSSTVNFWDLDKPIAMPWMGGGASKPREPLPNPVTLEPETKPFDFFPLGRVPADSVDQADANPRRQLPAGYSPAPILAVLGLLVVLVVGVGVMGWVRRYDGAEHMPLVAACSTSLAAATCPLSSKPPSYTYSYSGETGPQLSMDGDGSRVREDDTISSKLPKTSSVRERFDEGLSEQGLLWGVVDHGDGIGRHATPSQEPVGTLSVGALYS